MFQNREEAGQLLSKKLLSFKEKSNVLILGIPRGGVVVAKEVAKALGLPLDIVIVKKVGVPSNLELAIGAVGPEKTIYWDKDLCQRLGLSRSQMSNLKSQKEREREDREKALRANKPPLDIKEKTVIIVDDGIATGATVMATQKFLRKKQAGKIILATPVIAKDTLNNISKYFDNVIALSSEENFYAVGQFYREFPQVEDDEVIKILRNEEIKK